MKTCLVWAWAVGETADGTPVIERRLAAGGVVERPADVPASAALVEQDVDVWREEILSALAALDIKSIRALREGNIERINSLEAEAARLRDVLRGLSSA